MSAESAKNIMFKVASAYIYHDVYKGTAHTVAILDKIQYEEFNQFVKDYLPLKELSVCLLGPKGTNRMKKVWKEINEQTSR